MIFRLFSKEAFVEGVLGSGDRSLSEDVTGFPCQAVSISRPEQPVRPRSHVEIRLAVGTSFAWGTCSPLGELVTPREQCQSPPRRCRIGFTR